jgi:ABC-type glycerol-3-phosphate transport system substrate-binding protein
MMSVELYWDNDERTVMLLEFEGAWTWDELFATLARAKKAGDQAGGEIGAIINVTGGVRFPGGSLLNAHSFDNAKKLLALSDGKAGPMVVAGADGLMRTAFETMTRLNPQATGSVHFVPTLDAARAYLAQRLDTDRAAAS